MGGGTLRGNDRGLLMRWLINAAALLALPYLYNGVQVDGIGAALVAAAVLGIANAIIRPILLLLTIPLNIATLGLFTLVINALMLWGVSTVVNGFHVSGFIGAFIGSLLLTIVSAVLSAILR